MPYATPNMLQDFESEFVEILNQQCFRFLYQKLERARESPEGPLSTRNISLASSREVLKYIAELGISKVALRVEDIEAILVRRHLNRDSHPSPIISEPDLEQKYDS